MHCVTTVVADMTGGYLIFFFIFVDCLKRISRLVSLNVSPTAGVAWRMFVSAAGRRALEVCPRMGPVNQPSLPNCSTYSINGVFIYAVLHTFHPG